MNSWPPCEVVSQVLLALAGKEAQELNSTVPNCTSTKYRSSLTIPSTYLCQVGFFPLSSNTWPAFAEHDLFRLSWMMDKCEIHEFCISEGKPLRFMYPSLKGLGLCCWLPNLCVTLKYSVNYKYSWSSKLFSSSFFQFSYWKRFSLGLCWLSLAQTKAQSPSGGRFAREELAAPSSPPYVGHYCNPEENAFGNQKLSSCQDSSCVAWHKWPFISHAGSPSSCQGICQKLMYIFQFLDFKWVSHITVSRAWTRWGAMTYHWSRKKYIVRSGSFHRRSTTPCLWEHISLL